MSDLVKVILAIVIGWVFLQWLIGPSAGSPNLGGSLFQGWPYAAPLPGISPSALAWAPPYGQDFATQVGFNYGPNSGPNLSLGFQGWNL